MSPPELSSAVVLHERPRSPFSRKARWILARKGLVATIRAPEDERVLLLRYEGADLPLLELEDGVVAGSRSIAFRVERSYPEPSLFPADARRRNQAVTLDEFADHGLGRLAWALLGGGAVLAGDGLEPARGERSALVAALRDNLDQVRQAIRKGALDAGAAHLGDLSVAAHLVTVAEIEELRLTRDAADLADYAERVRSFCGSPR
jgi:glutathione S-transferase